MATTFLKRQKEMKRQEKQREKAERRAQKKLANRAATGGSQEIIESPEVDASADQPAPPDSESRD